MNSIKEIVFSFSLALVTLLTYFGLSHSWTIQMRVPPLTEPIASQGPYEMDNSDTDDGKPQLIQSARMQAPDQPEVIVAVIDTGCDIHHPALAPYLWKNPGEDGLDQYGTFKATNGFDDDNNGVVDDFYGWDFSSNSPNVIDNHGHGTHIAGIISAVSPSVRLMTLKYYDSDSAGINNLQNTIDAIYYAVRMGAQVINYSSGGLIRSQGESDAISWAEARGVLVVASAGNEGMNSDFNHFYPANYDHSNILSVGAIDRNEDLMRMSNYGRVTVDVFAPGANIYSTIPNGLYGYMSGTSQATAYISGLVSAIISNSRDKLNPDWLIQHLIKSTIQRPNLIDKSKSGGVVDLALALNRKEPILTSSINQRTPAQTKSR